MRSGLVAVVLAVSIAVVVPVAAGAEAPADTLLGYVALPSVDSSLRNLEATIELFAPGRVQPGMLKMGLGMSLQDPGLANLADEPFALLFFKPVNLGGPPLVALCATVLKSEGYERALAGQGWKTKVVDGVLVASIEEAGLAAAEGHLGTYRGIKGTGDLQISVRSARVLDAYWAVLQTAVDGMVQKLAEAPKTVDGSGLATIVKLEAMVGLALGSQIEEMRTDVSFGPGAFTADTVMSLRPGTALADLASMPAPGPNATRGLVTGPGILRGTAQLDTQRFGVFFMRTLSELPKGTAPVALTPEIITALRALTASCFGESTFRMTSTAAAPLLIESAARVADERACLGDLEKGAALFGTEGPFGKLLQSVTPGHSQSFEKDARRRGDVAIHRWKVGLDESHPQAKALRNIVKDSEVAITRGYYLNSNDPAALDALIDRVVAGAPGTAADLEAIRSFGPGYHVYFDYDFIGLMKAMQDAMPQGGQAFGNLAVPAAAEPVSFAAGFSDGTVRTRGRFPLSTLTTFIQAISKAKGEAKAVKVSEH